MFDVLCGIALVGIGYLLGARTRPKSAAVELTEEEKRAERKSLEEWEKFLKFNGRAGD